MKYKSAEFKAIVGAILLLLLFVGYRSALAEDSRSSLLILGSDDRYWVAQTEPAHDQAAQPLTTVFVRALGDSRFYELLDLNDSIASWANRGTQLAILKPDGQWSLYSEAGTVSLGPDLPGGARIIALAGGEDTFWAISTAGELSPRELRQTTTSPTTVAATAPVAMPVKFPPSLFRLDRGIWTAVAPLPADAPLEPHRVSLAVIGGKPYLAMLKGGELSLADLQRGVWNIPPHGPGIGTDKRIALLQGTTSPILYVAAPAGQTIQLIKGSSLMSDHYAPGFSSAGAEPVAVGYALGRIHILYSNQGTLREQLVDPQNLRPIGAASDISLRPQEMIPSGVNPARYFILSALTVAVLVTISWRSKMRGMIFDLEKLRLAPFPRRAMAGGIDLFPVMIGVFFAGHIPDEKRQEAAFLAGLALYLFLVTLTEVISGRSIGKWLLGLEVVNLTGDAPSRSSLFIRNLLRLIDVGFAMTPLLMVFAFPLRQRIGDMAAGTLVVQSVSSVS